MKNACPASAVGLASILLAGTASAATLSNGTLTVVIRDDNGAIEQVLFGGSDFYNPGTAVSNWGLQNGTDTSTFTLNHTDGSTAQPVVVSSGGGVVSVTGTYTGGGASVDFVRNYELAVGLNHLRITTQIVNNGSALTLGYFDTFDPDQGIDQGLSFSTFNDVFVLAGAMVGRAVAEDNGLTVVMGSTDASVTVASGLPFEISGGSVLNDFFDAPFDGEGALADSGTHVGLRVFLAAGASRTFTYRQAYGVSPGDASLHFIGVCGNAVWGETNWGSMLWAACLLEGIPALPHTALVLLALSMVVAGRFVVPRLAPQ